MIAIVALSLLVATSVLVGGLYLAVRIVFTNLRYGP